MVRNKFDQQLKELNHQMVHMGKLCELAITNAATALASGSAATAQQVIRADTHIDQAERDIEHLCMKLLLRQQPVARDLRQISAALKMITDLERIGDQAADIAEIVLTSQMPGMAGFPKIIDMAQCVTRMVADAISAYVDRDVALSSAVVDTDAIVDDLFTHIRSELIEFIVQSGHQYLRGSADEDCAQADCLEASEEAQRAIDLMMITKYLERIGDHATNVAEWVAFSITGVHSGRFDAKDTPSQ